jgi:16S rRNA (uracil1498-N3)-methyltransferase
MDRRDLSRLMARRIPIPDLAAGDRTLAGAVAHYVAHVLRMRAGDAFVAFDPSTGLEADGLMLSLGSASSGSSGGSASSGSSGGSGSSGSSGGSAPSGSSGETVDVRLGVPRPGTTAPGRDIVWVQALPKGSKCDAIVRDATELGATRILVVETRRTVVRLDPPRAAARVERWRRIARDAARQSGRAAAPRIDALGRWNEALASVGAECERFCLWERAIEPLGPRLFAALERDSPLAFASGPEGGFDEEEIAAATKYGWTVVSLGNRLLRAETVAAAVLGSAEIGSQAFAR